MNFARRTDSGYANFRKFGSISLGLGSLPPGYINCNWILPDYTPALIVYSLAHLTLDLLVLLLPKEFFIIVSEFSLNDDGLSQQLEPLQSTGEAFRQAARRLVEISTCCRWVGKQATDKNKDVADLEEAQPSRPLGLKQQLAILAVLMEGLPDCSLPHPARLRRRRRPRGPELCLHARGLP